jgi:hypothetical protein
MTARVPSAGIYSPIFGLTITQLHGGGALHAIDVCELYSNQRIGEDQ